MPKPTSDRRATERKHPWPMVRLGDVCEITAGNSAPQDKNLFLDGTHPFVRTSDVGEIHFGVIESSRDKLNDAGIIGLRLFPKGSVLFPKSGASTYLNHRVLLGVDAYVVSHLAVIMPHVQVYPLFLLYALAGIDAKTLMQDCSYPALRTAEIAAAKIPLPPLSVQREIVARLERELAAVEKMKKGFEALAETARAEFKAELKEAFYEGCSCEKTWDEVFYTTTGKLDSNCAISDGKYPFFTCSKEVLRINEWAFDCEALLLAGNNAAGKYDVKHYVGKFNAYQRTYVLTLKNADWEYKLFQAQLENLLQYLQDKSKGTSTRYLTKGILRTLRFYVPEPFVQREVVARLDGAKAKAEKLEAKVREGVAVCETMRKAILKEAFE